MRAERDRRLQVDRVVHVGPSSLPLGYELGGAVERRMVELAAAQAAAGGHPLLVSAGSTTGGPASLHGVPVTRIRCRLRRPWRDFELLVRSSRQIRRWRPDVVHVHNNPWGAVVLRAAGAPVVLSVDFVRYRWSDRRAGWHIYRWAIDRFALLLPVSQFCLDEARRWWKLPGERLRVLWNGVDVEKFRPDPSRREAARARLVPGGGMVVGYVGRVNEQKGSDVLVEAYRLVRDRGCTALSLVVAGPAGQFGSTGGNHLTEQIRAVGGRWLGAVPEAELADVYRCLDVFVMPTREHEMFGMAAAEALACGVPVVCTDLGGLPEVVPLDAGLRVPPGDAEALADALVELAEDPDRVRRLAGRARPAAIKFGWDQVAASADVAYAQALPGHQLSIGARQRRGQ